MALNYVVSGTGLNCLLYPYILYELQNQQEVVSPSSARYMYFPFSTPTAFERFFFLPMSWDPLLPLPHKNISVNLPMHLVASGKQKISEEKISVVNGVHCPGNACIITYLTHSLPRLPRAEGFVPSLWCSALWEVSPKNGCTGFFTERKRGNETDSSCCGGDSEFLWSQSLRGQGPGKPFS